MSFTANRKLTILTILILLVVWLAAIFLIDKEYKGKYEDYIAYRDEVFDNGIAGVVRTYESFSNYIFTSAIDRDSIKGYLLEANHGDDLVKAEMRKKLADELEETHELISRHNFRQFHFQLANGDSFYRFHNPDKFGDNLLDIRESMRIANLEKKYVTGFEEGRTFNGYRFVYPISMEGEHLGSIEISISPQRVLEEMFASDPNRDLGFMMAKDIMEGIVFEDEQKRYHINFISDEYVSDVEISAFADQREDSLNLHKDPAFVEKLRELVGQKLHDKDPISKSMVYDKKTYLIQYRPIIDLSNKPVGYFYGFKEDTHIQTIIMAKELVAILATAIMLVLVLLILYAHIRQKELQKLAMTDQLTKVYNRHSFYLLANREKARAERNGEPLTVAMVDIDFFKKVNDKHGHATGDDVLKTVASLIKESIRETDILARYGGEEFVILMPATDLKNALVAAERIRKVVANYDFNKVGNITVSIGLAEKIKKEEIDITIDRADKALYVSKETGRNKVSLSEEGERGL